MKKKLKWNGRILSLILAMILLVQPQLIYGGEDAVQAVNTEVPGEGGGGPSETGETTAGTGEEAAADFGDGSTGDSGTTESDNEGETSTVPEGGSTDVPGTVTTPEGEGGAEFGDGSGSVETEGGDPAGSGESSSAPESDGSDDLTEGGSEELPQFSDEQDDGTETETTVPEEEGSEDIPPTEEAQIQEPSDGSLAGNTVYFVDVNWESAPLAAVQAVFDGGTAQAAPVSMENLGQGIYSAVIPQGDHSRITFQKPSEEAPQITEENPGTFDVDFGDGSEAPAETLAAKTYSAWTNISGSWNYYGQESLMENTLPVAFAAGTMDSFYYNTQSGEGYWGETPVKETGIRSDGSLAGQTMKFVNLFWGTDDMGEIEAVFDGGQDEALVQAMSRGDRGVYETTVPEGDYSRVSFRYAGNTDPFMGSTYNFYGAVSDDGVTKTTAFIPVQNNTLYYDMGENPSYWGADPGYEVTDPETPVTVLSDQPQAAPMRAPAAASAAAPEAAPAVTAPETEEKPSVEGQPQPGEMVYALDLDEREKYMAGQPANTYRVHIAFMKQGHTPVEDISQIPEGEGVIYTMYEKSTGVYSAPFPADVEKYSEIGFKLVTKEGQESPVNTGSRHFNFRGYEPTTEEEQSKFGHFKYLSGITDTYYMNAQQDDSYWGAHPSNADQSLDTQVLYVDTNDKNDNNIVIDINDIWISWHKMPQGTGTDENFDPVKGWKVTDTLPHAGIRYFQFPKNSNATENTILTMRFKVVDEETEQPTPTYGDQEFTYKFTLVPRSQRNRLNLDYYWMFNGQMWDHFEAGEGLTEREVFFASVRNEYDGVWMRVANEDGKYAGIEEIKTWGWTEEQIEERVEEFKDKDGKTTFWLKLDKVEEPEEYRKEKNKLFRLKIPGNYTKVQFRTEENKKIYYSNQTTISEKVANPCYFAFQVGDPLEAVPIEDVKEPGIVGQWASVYSVNNAGDQSVDIPEKKMEWEENVYYVDTTMYDYYSDWETTGRKVADWTTESVQKYYRHQAKVFNAAADQYYRDKVKDPNDSDLPALYEAQLEQDNTGNYFINEFTGKDHWNYNVKTQNGRNQNRWTGAGGGPFFGIAADQLVNGNIVFNSEDDENVIMPTFNEAFLRGENVMDTAVGNVYKNVKFPIKMDQEEGSDTEGYWVYDSADKNDAFRLSYDVDEGYFMDRTYQGISFRGRNAFYPFNDAEDWGLGYDIDTHKNNSDVKMSRANCLFGAKLQFQFRVTEDGMVVDPKGNKVPISFEFQGDDDVWIYVDNQLVLDLGGNHDAVRGTISFAGNEKHETEACRNAPFYEIRRNLDVGYAGEGVQVKHGGLPAGILDPTKTHTLTMFYMERGLYESNMKLTFNFPRDNRFIVEKEVDVESTRTEGDDIFAPLLEEMGSFNYNLKNQVTSGGTLPVEESAGYRKPGENVPIYTADNPADFTQGVGMTWERTDTGSVIVKQEGDTVKGDTPDEKTLLKVDPQETLNASDMEYLRLSMTNLGISDRNARNLYFGFVDANGKRVGGYAGELDYEGESNTFLAEQESILRLNFKNMKGDSAFDWSQVDYMLVGFRNPTGPTAYEISYAAFYKRSPEKLHTGFYVDDGQISDYGSFESGQLSPVDGTWYTKQTKGADGEFDNGTAWNTEGGTFNLADGQRAVFTDKFRTGSYIALEETREPKIFDTKWTLTENGKEIPAKYLLTTRHDLTTVQNPLDMITEEYPLTDVAGDAGDKVSDGRKAIAKPDWTGKPDKNPSETPTIVYRSYQDPDSSANIGVDIGVKFTNTLKRGSLTIKKKLTESLAVNGRYEPAEFTFKVYFTDVAGRSLEKQLEPINEEERYVLYEVTVRTDENGEGQVTIPNIPAGTHYYVAEVPSNGTQLIDIEIGKECDTAPEPHEDLEIGKLPDADENDWSNKWFEGTAYASDQSVTFTNDLRPFYMKIQKEWKDGLTDEERAALAITEVHIQLQRAYVGTDDWKVVTRDYFDNSIVEGDKDPYIKLNKENKWQVESKIGVPLPEKDENGRRYKYQLQELNHQNIFGRYEATYSIEPGEIYKDEEGKTYLRVTYKVVNTPAQLQLRKQWEDPADGKQISQLRVKLMVSSAYDPNNPEAEAEWKCFETAKNPNHTCTNACWQILNARGDWVKSMKNLIIKDGEKPYYYKLAEEEIFIDGQWKPVKQALSGCKVTYGDPVTLEKVEEGKLIEVTATNKLEMGSLNIIKQDAEDETKLLPDAEFKVELLNWKGEELPEQVEEAEFDKLEADPDYPAKTGKTDKNGQLSFKNLPYGIYRITEVDSPTGYTLLKKPIYVIISDQAFENQEQEHGDDPTYNKESKTITITVKNQKGLTIPLTGGNGFFKFTLAGLFLFGAAALMYKFRPIGRRAHQSRKKHRK